MKLKIDFVSSVKLNGKPQKKKINYILGRVKDGSILVMDGVMSPEEEMDLIKETMRRVDNGFPGIEVCSLKKQLKGFNQLFELLSIRREKFWNWLTKKQSQTNLKTGMTLIGPAKLIKKIKKNPDSFSVMAEVK
jgi:hypothetical protein